MDLSIIVFLIALFIMLTSAITTELIRNKRQRSLMKYVPFTNALVFLGAVVFFIRGHDPVYMVIGMFFSVGVLVFTYYKYTDF